MVDGWTEHKILTGHGKEVYDLRWSSDEKNIVSSSLDFSVILWDAESGQLKQKLEGHTNYVKGVTIDPLNTHVVSLSTDRSLRIYKTLANSNHMVCKNVLFLSNSKNIKHLKIKVSEEEGGGYKNGPNFFMDENIIEK